MKKWIIVILCFFLLSACSKTVPSENVINATPATQDSLENSIDIQVEKTAAPQNSPEPPVDYSVYQDAKDAAVAYLKTGLAGDPYLYVYKDFSDVANHFTQRAKVDDGNSDYVYDMNENWQEDPYSGSSAIEVRVKTSGKSWGGWLFLNGYLPAGEIIPQLSFGEIEGAGEDLTGAARLVFEAKGAEGGEVVEFFTAGLGYNGETNARMEDYPDSSHKISLGFIELTQEWQTYTINLDGANLTSIGCGFGFVLSGVHSGSTESVFYLDDIRFEGEIAQLQDAPRLLKSYETNQAENQNDIYIQNAAFTYDNALAALAFISEGDQDEAERILDAFVYGVENDRYQQDRIRNAYAYGDIRALPGWESGARMPGWYDIDAKEYYEDQYQVGSNVGNTSFAAMALLQYYDRYGGEEYLNTAKTIMEWVLDNCTDGTVGFTAGYDGWPEGDGSSYYVYTYKSTEHNIDAYAVFNELYSLTSDERYRKAADSALDFIISMYDPEKGYFYTGTGNDGSTPNKENVVLDAQVWTLLSLGIEQYDPFVPALETAIEMKTLKGGYPFHAANENGGWWPEGTAFTALALREYGLNSEVQSALDALSGIQLSSGGFPAATVSNLSTGFNLFTGDPWTYGENPHIAPTAWFVMAVNGFNPYSFEE